MNMSTESIVVILLVGIVAGWLAGKIVRGTGFGLVGDLLVGIAGAFVASWLFPDSGSSSAPASSRPSSIRRWARSSCSWSSA
jgi:uncharacterized membrane protein YeaQ/YmgE (transglycosylase-associated protein family)